MQNNLFLRNGSALQWLHPEHGLFKSQHPTLYSMSLQISGRLEHASPHLIHRRLRSHLLPQPPSFSHYFLPLSISRTLSLMFTLCTPQLHLPRRLEIASSAGVTHAFRTDDSFARPSGRITAPTVRLTAPVYHLSREIALRLIGLLRTRWFPWLLLFGFVLHLLLLVLYSQLVLLIRKLLEILVNGGACHFQVKVRVLYQDELFVFDAHFTRLEGVDAQPTLHSHVLVIHFYLLRYLFLYSL